MSFTGFEELRLSVKCNRKKHTECKNQKNNCGCQCHVVKKKNEFVNEINEVKQLADYYNDRRILSWILRVLN